MSTSYGMPPTPPPSVPATPPQKSRIPLYIALACGCAFLLVLVLAAVGVGLFLIGEDAEEGPEPTSTVSPSDPGPTESPSDSPSEHPTTGLETDQPVDKPTEGPETEATSSAADALLAETSYTDEVAADGEEVRLPVDG